MSQARAGQGGRRRLLLMAAIRQAPVSAATSIYPSILVQAPRPAAAPAKASQRLSSCSNQLMKAMAATRTKQASTRSAYWDQAMLSTRGVPNSASSASLPSSRVPPLRRASRP